MSAPSIYDVEVESIRGRVATLEKYRGNVLLIVNTASKDDFTPQYAELEALHRDLGPRGLTVLAFPCAQIGGEPWSAKEIETFVTQKFGVSFPLHAKVEVSGRGAHVLYRYLGAAMKDDLGRADVTENFEKFLVDRAGKVVARYGGRTAPGSIRAAIERLL